MIKSWSKKWILLACILMMLVCSSWIRKEDHKPWGSVSTDAEENRFSFIRYNLNKLQVQNTESNWDNLFRKMESLAFTGQGKISVVHIGGSHVQGGALTDRLRSNLSQMLYGAQGERGFVYPFDLSGTNSPHSIKALWTGKWKGARSSVTSSEMLWGVSGISATTTDSIASINISALDYVANLYKFNKVRIYNQRSHNVVITPDTLVELVNQKDFPEFGYTELEFSSEITNLHFEIQRIDNEESFFTFQGVYLGNNDNGLTYNAIGVNGANAMSYMRGSMFQPQLNTLKPDLAIFGIGVNDANVPNGAFNAQLYKERLEAMIKMFQVANPDVCFIFITNNDTYYKNKSPNKNIFEVREILYSLAERYDGAVYDMFEIMGGLGSILDWQKLSLASKDKIHLTKRGYELQADMMTQAFQEAFGNYLNNKHKY